MATVSPATHRATRTRTPSGDRASSGVPVRAGRVLSEAVPLLAASLAPSLRDSIRAHLVAAGVLAFLVPAYAMAAVLLWRRRPWGYVLGAVMLVAGALTQVTYMVALVFQSRAGISGESVFDPYAPVLAVYLVGTGLLLTNLRGGRDAMPGRNGRPGRR